MATKWLTNRHTAAVPALNPRPASFTIIWLAVVSANIRLCVFVCVHLYLCGVWCVCVRACHRAFVWFERQQGLSSKRRRNTDASFWTVALARWWSPSFTHNACVLLSCAGEPAHGSVLYGRRRSVHQQQDSGQRLHQGPGGRIRFVNTTTDHILVLIITL